MARGYIQTMERGKHRIRLSLGEGPDGKRKEYSKVVYGTKADAQRLLDEKKMELRQTGRIIEPSKEMLENFLTTWKETVMEHKVTEKTAESYWQMLTLYIIPDLGSYPLGAITPDMVQKKYNQMIRNGLSPRTIKYTHSVFNSAMAHAVKWKKIQNNPLSLLDLPKDAKEEQKAMTSEQVKLFMQAAEGNRRKILFETMIVTGLRPGEIYGLKWTDIDLEKGTLSVRRALSRLRGGEWRLGEPKTKRSRRSMPIPLGLIKSLQQQKQQNAADKMESRVRIEKIRQEVNAGKRDPVEAEKSIQRIQYNDQNFVFPNKKGGPMDHSTVRGDDFKKILKKSGLDHIGFRMYDLRHTCATMLLKAGINPKVISERLGHASVTLTLDTYSHCLPDMQEEASEALNKMIY